MENRLTIGDLKQKRHKSLLAAEKAARMKPEAYRDLRETVTHVINNTIDISRYDQTAQRLARLLDTLAKAAPGSIFDYFQENIDPRKQGRPTFFRAMCTDLDRQIKTIDNILAGKLKHTVITPDCFKKTDNNGEFRT